MRTNPLPSKSTEWPARTARLAAIIGACLIPVCTSCSTMALDAGLAGGRPGWRLHRANPPGPAASAYRYAPDRIFGEAGRPMIEPVRIEPVVVAVVLASSIALEEIDRHGHSAIGEVGSWVARVVEHSVACPMSDLSGGGYAGLRVRPRLGPATSSENAAPCPILSADPPRTVLR
jgi:hypothetical protein